jgi:hypothetical protein
VLLFWVSGGFWWMNQLRTQQMRLRNVKVVRESVFSRKMWNVFRFIRQGFFSRPTQHLPGHGVISFLGPHARAGATVCRWSKKP